MTGFPTPTNPDESVTPAAPPAGSTVQQPLADPGWRTHPLSPLVSSWIALVAVAFFVIRDLLEHGSLQAVQNLGSLVIYLGIGGVVLLGSVVLSWFSWYATRHRLDDDGLTIETKLIVHETKRLLYRRIQSVEINQPLAARLLGLCRLSIDVGGDGGAKISFLKRQQAENLRHDLLRRAVQAKRGPELPLPQPAADATGAAAPWPAPARTPAPTARQRLSHELHHGGDGLADTEAPRHLVVQVAPRALIIAAITSGEFLATLVGFAVFGLVHQLTDGIIGLGYGLVLLLPIGGYILNRVIKEWRFRVETDGEGLRISHGMTDLTTSNTPFDRIQGFRLEQGMLWRPFGWWRVRMTVLGKGGAMDEDSDSSDVALAIGTWDEAMAVIDTVWPGLNLHDIALNPVPVRAKWFLWGGRKLAGWALTDQLAVSRRGWLGQEFNVIDHARAQSVLLHQGPLDRRLRLASVDIDLVHGPVRMRFAHLDPADARRVVDTQPGLARAARERRAATGRSLSTRPEPASPSMPPPGAPPPPAPAPAPWGGEFPPPPALS
ncbi:PH domain-containing protein [Propionibacteriaceae bacterium Y1923]|uniref:PH domain-containing protein n=1 Tax=Aestuariimicrobium sp. Y1814 TaxID=3418742 RepID=UPI003C26C974